MNKEQIVKTIYFHLCQIPHGLVSNQNGMYLSCMICVQTLNINVESKFVLLVEDTSLKEPALKIRYKSFQRNSNCWE